MHPAWYHSEREAPGRWKRHKRPIYSGASRWVATWNDKTTDLSDVQVVARVLVQLRVVGVENGGVDAVSVGNTVASVAVLNYIGGGAVLAWPTETEGAARLEIVARGVDDVGIDGSKLETGRR